MELWISRPSSETASCGPFSLFWYSQAIRSNVMARNLTLMFLCLHIYRPLLLFMSFKSLSSGLIFGNSILWEIMLPAQNLSLFIHALQCTPFRSLSSSPVFGNGLLWEIMHTVNHFFPRLTFQLIGQANTSSQDHHLLQNLTERSALTTNGNPNLTTLKWDG